MLCCVSLLYLMLLCYDMFSYVMLKYLLGVVFAFGAEFQKYEHFQPKSC